MNYSQTPLSTLPPPDPQEYAEREQWRHGPPQRKQWGTMMKAIVVAGAILIGLAVVGGIVSNSEDSPSRRMTLTEAACGMLDDGKDRDLVYEVLKDLAADHPSVYGEDEAAAARAALNRAEGQGCG